MAEGEGEEQGAGLHLTVSARLVMESMRRLEVQTWEGEQEEVIDAFLKMKVGEQTEGGLKFLTPADETWGTPFVGGLQAPRRAGNVWTCAVTYVQLRKVVLWTLDFAEVQKDIRTWRQNLPAGSDGEPNPDAPDLVKLAQWERAKELNDWSDYDAFQTADGEALEGATLELAQMIRKGIESYTIHTPVPTMTMRYFDEVSNVGKLLDKYLPSLPYGPPNWTELGGADIHGQLDALTNEATDGSGGTGTIAYKWLCTADKATPNGDGSCTRTVQFMRVDAVEDKLYKAGSPEEGGFA